MKISGQTRYQLVKLLALVIAVVIVAAAVLKSVGVVGTAGKALIIVGAVVVINIFLRVFKIF